MTPRHLFWIALLLAAVPPSFEATTGCGFSPGVATQTPEDDNALNCECTCSGAGSVTVQVLTGSDDAEENNGAVNLTEASLDFGTRIVGIRFDQVGLPPGVTIQSAIVRFSADTNDGSSTDLTIAAETSIAAPTFTTTPSDLSNRTVGSQVAWSTVPAWTNGSTQDTPDLSSLLQTLVGQANWSTSSPIVLRIEGTGHRSARSFNGTAAKAPSLIVSYDTSVAATLPVCASPGVEQDAEGHLTADALTMECGRVATTLDGLAGSCGYPTGCSCTPVAFQDHAASFEAGSCDTTCTPTPSDPMCTNFDPKAFVECLKTDTLDNCKHFVAATNAPGAPSGSEVCVASGSPLAFHAFGHRSRCEVGGTTAIRVGDREPQHDPATTGAVEILGGPCPGGGCSVSPYIGLVMDPITFSVKFASDPTFSNLNASGRGLETALVDAGGLASFPPAAIAGNANGQRGSDARTLSSGNATPVTLGVDWVGKTCSLDGNLAGEVDGEVPDGHCDGDDSVACTVDSPDCDDAGGPCVFPEDTQPLVVDVALDGTLVNQPPTAAAGPDQTVECTSSAGASFALDGRGSSDPDGNLALASWREGSRTGPLVSGGLTAAPQLGVGATDTFVLRVIDAYAQTDEDEVSVAVVDTTPPELSLAVSPATLWPPNHKLVPLMVFVTAQDTCDPSPAIRLVSITSDEPENGLGDGDTGPDVQGAEFGTDDRAFLLRAERSGTGSGRTYTITYEAEDASGNSTVRQATVSVPH